ncbi:MAG: 50S ribosomal protein L4 [Oligoflexales bacterium]
MKWDVVNIKGEVVSHIDLPSDVYEVEMNDGVLHSVVKAYRANRRQGTHATKTRGMVAGSGRKPFKQKGTGNARQGSSTSPLMPGGGTAHGPQPRDYRQGINRKVKTLATRIALSDKVRHNKLIVVDDFQIDQYKTKAVEAALQNLGVKKALIADARADDFLYRSARNLHGVLTLAPEVLNAENILRYESLVLSQAALEVLRQRLSGGAE